MDGFVLSIDQGTTGTTALVFDRECRVRGRGYSEFTQHYPRPGWVEHDAEEIWRVSLKAAADALGAAGVGAEGLRAVGITNQRETVVAWERATSAPVARRRLAGQALGRDVRRAEGARARRLDSREDRARVRPVLLRHEVALAARKHAGLARARRERAGRLRHS